MTADVTGPRVGYTGEPGAFAEEAVLRFFASPAAVPSSSFRAVFEGVRDGSLDAGVVPVESSLLGSIRENLDLLWAFDLPIAGEVSVPVRLALLALPGERLETIERVYSISAALAQADEFLRSRPWTVLTTYNTAGAARQVAERGERGAAAVASARVAPIYGLEVLADGIQSGADNHTRFAVLAGAGTRAGSAPGPRPPPSPGRRGPRSCSPSGTCPDRCTGPWVRSRPAGSTSRASSPARGPSAGSRWEYLFWVDLDADPADPACAAALGALGEETEVVRILGTYPRAPED